MEIRLNLTLKNFGNNSTPSVTFFCEDFSEVRKLVEAYKPVLRTYSVFSYEYQSDGDTFITIRKEVKRSHFLLLPQL